MAFLWISAFFLLGVAKTVMSDYDLSVCSILTESYGLIPPPLPTNFEMKGELADHLQNTTIYHEVYFDYTNFRGKYMFLEKGVERHFLFDYDVSQVVQWDVFNPGVDFKRDPLSHVCVATEMSESQYKDIFGYVDDNIKTPRMFNSNEMMRYGGKYQYAYNGSDVLHSRGLPVNNFIGCIYDFSTDATVNTNFSFSADNVAPSGGTGQAEVIGAENGMLSIPVRIDYDGAVPGEDGEPHFFHKTESISWFKGEPEFALGTFQIPPWMYCQDYRGSKDMPKFPTAFTTRMTKTTLVVDILGSFNGNPEQTSYESIMYYKEKKLARRDYTPDAHIDSEIKSKFQNLSPVITIYDFNIGLLYITNQPSGRCFIRPIRQGDFFETSKQNMFIQMGEPEEIFLMQTDKMEYKGTAFARDIDCDVFNGKYYDPMYHATYMKETYISTNGWHEEAGDMVGYGVPVKHTIITQDLQGESVERVTSFDFLKFIAEPPPLEDYDVSNCIETVEHKHFAILLTLSSQSRDLLFTYKSQFLETAQYYLTDVAQVLTPLRIQRLQLQRVSIANARTFLRFTLVGKPDLKTNILFPIKGASLSEAIRFLQNFVDSGRFAINFYPPKSKEPTLVPVLPKSLYVLKSSGDLQAIPFSPQDSWDEQPNAEDKSTSETQKDNSSPEVEEHPGMSSGALALLSISMLIIGVGMGIAFMYLYIRFYNEKYVEDKLQLSASSIQEETSFETGATAELPQ